MEYLKLGGSDLLVSRVCLGTMTYGDQNTEAEAHEQLDFAVQSGINFIDTAEMYPVPPKAETYTRTETIVGNWLKKQPRDKIILGTKVAGANRKLDWIRGGPLSLDRDNIRTSIEGSLKRLQTDYIDLFQLHWPDRNVPIFGKFQFDVSEEYQAGKQKEWVPIRAQLETLAELVKEGKVRYVGLSNEQPWGVMQFVRMAEEFNLPRIVSIQNCFNLINRVFEFGMAEIAFRENIGLLAYSPLAFGYLSGKYVTDPKAQGRVNLFPGYAQRYSKPNVPIASEKYATLARQHGISPAQMALSFVMHRWFTASTIIGATSMAQLKENISAWDVTLPENVIAEIEALHLRYMNPAP